jgi:hypothetical protein
MMSTMRKHYRGSLLKDMVTIFSSATVCGRKNVVCFHNLASKIITGKWYEDRQVDFGKESERIVETVANLIKASLHETVYNTSEYPKASSMDDLQEGKQWVPPLLMSFMQTLMSHELKQMDVVSFHHTSFTSPFSYFSCFVEHRSFFRSHVWIEIIFDHVVSTWIFSVL